MTSDNLMYDSLFQLKNENPLLSKTPPTHQVRVSRKDVLCTSDSSKCFETPCIEKLTISSEIDL